MTRSWPILRLLVLQIVVFAIPVALLIGWTVTERQAEVLRGMGCDLLQGYGIGRPLDQAATEALLLSRGRLDQATA